LEPNEAGPPTRPPVDAYQLFLAPIADQAGCFGFAVYPLNFKTEFNYPFYSDLPLGGLQIDLHSSCPLSGDHGRYLPALS